MNVQKTNDTSNTARFHSVIAYISEQTVKDWAGNDKGFAEALSIEQILRQCDKVYLSPRYFQQFFHRMSGECIGAYINNLRMEHAAHLLQNTNIPVLSIACKVGFASENALFKPFKKRFHVTPLQFKNQHRTIQPPSHATEITPTGTIKLMSPQHFIYRTYVGDYAEYNTAAFDAEAWDSLYDYAEKRNLLSSLPEYYGICLDDSNIRQPNRCRFYACMTVSHPLKKTDGIIRPMQIKGGKYSIYKYVGSYNGLNAFYQAIFRHFEYELRDDFILERYLNGPQEVSEEALETEVLIPV